MTTHSKNLGTALVVWSAELHLIGPHTQCDTSGVCDMGSYEKGRSSNEWLDNGQGRGLTPGTHMVPPQSVLANQALHTSEPTFLVFPRIWGTLYHLSELAHKAAFFSFSVSFT